MQWEKWDPDVVEVTEAEGGLKDGATFNFVMKKPQGQKIPCTLSDVKKGECLTFSGKSLGGLLKFSGTVQLTPVDTSTTSIVYTFSMSGCIGTTLSTLAPAPVVGGVENGLANMVSLSEEGLPKIGCF